MKLFALFFALATALDDMLLMLLMQNQNSSPGQTSQMNMMLPLLLGASDSSDEDTTMDMLVLMMAMQSQAPGTAFGTDMMLPLLLMDDESDNETLLFFMMMNQGKTRCEPAPVYVQPAAPVVAQREPQVQTVFRTWRVNADGTRELVSEESSN